MHLCDQHLFAREHRYPFVSINLVKPQSIYRIGPLGKDRVIPSQYQLPIDHSPALKSAEEGPTHYDHLPMTRMNKELFGVFGDRAEFGRLRSEQAFDVVVNGERSTVGIRDPDLGLPGRSATYTNERGICVVWGEAHVPESNTTNVARWILSQYADHGKEVVSEVSGSYLVFIEYDGDGRLITDPIRSWECFYTDDPGGRVFGTDVATVAMFLEGPSVRRRALTEFLHIGTVLGDRTLFTGLNRVPFDGGLTDSTVESYQRFIYSSRSFDYAEELAARLQRAIHRRAHYPGQKGLLLSAGYDSRTVLACLPAIDYCYSIGTVDSREMRVAKRIAAQYDTAHTVLEPDYRYVFPTPDKVRYSQAIKESLHIHHAGYTDEIDVDTIYHGLLHDTFFRGYYNRPGGTTLLGKQIPIGKSSRPDDVVGTLLNQLRDVSDDDALAACASDVFPELNIEDPGASIRESVADELEECTPRADSVYNKMALFAIRNQPAKAFRTHLADNYLETLVAADTELLSWHLQTPPEHRSTETFLQAMRRLDPDILQHPPPDRPYDRHALNQLERFIRRKLPYVEAFQHAWPDRDSHYEECRLDQRLFPDTPSVHRLPTREKLRINDARQWIQWIHKSSNVTRTVDPEEGGNPYHPRNLLRLIRGITG